MPTYEYDCKGCGHEFERFQKMSDDPVTVCPECGESKVVRRISSGGGILFKGPGFYATDYRKGPTPAEKRAESGSTGGGGSSSSGGSGAGESGGGSRDSTGGSKDSTGGSKE
jgi:putative FmdB family regulatory protein